MYDGMKNPVHRQYIVMNWFSICQRTYIATILLQLSENISAVVATDNLSKKGIDTTALFTNDFFIQPFFIATFEYNQAVGF